MAVTNRKSRCPPRIEAGTGPLRNGAGSQSGRCA